MNDKTLTKYNSVLKALAKGTKIADGFAVDGKQISATNLTIFATLNYNTANTGVVNEMGLERLALDPESDITAFTHRSMTDLKDFPELSEIHFKTSIQMTPEINEALFEAVNYISGDQMRPALTAVWIRNGSIYATDGYRAIRKVLGLPKELDGVNLTKQMINLYKKVAKIGNWFISVSDHNVRLSNPDMTLTSNLIEAQFPDLDQIFRSASEFDTVLMIPLETIRKIADKNHPHMNINLKTDEISIAGYSEAPVPTGIHIKQVKPVEMAKFTDYDDRKVIMPLTKNDPTFVGVSLENLKGIKADKDGSIRLWIKSDGTTTPMELI